MRLAIRTVQTTMFFWLGLAATSCGTSEPPYLAYRATFDKSMAVDAERHLREVASRWELVVHEHSKSVTGGVDKFTTFMFHDDRSYERRRWMVVASSYDLGTGDDPGRSRMFLHFYDNGDMPIEALDRLAFEIKHTMQDRFGLEFCRVNPPRSVCDEEYRQLEEAREARLRAKGWRLPSRSVHGNGGGFDELSFPEPKKRIPIERISGVNPGAMTTADG